MLPLYLSLDDVLLLPQHSYINSRSEVDLSWNLGEISLTFPLITVNMDCVTGVEMAIAMGKLGGLSIMPRFDAPEVQAEKIKKVKEAGVPVAAAIGIKDEELTRAKLLVAAGVDHLSLDVAHGHLEKTLIMLKKVRKEFPKISLSAGVVGTYQGAKDLFKAGADIVRVGVGPGTICTTRIATGCGVPQFTAIQECARAARELKKIIWADGGTKNSGDIVKCLAAGASAVCAGSLFAGATESPSKIVKINGKKYKVYNASTCATEKKKQYKKYLDDKKPEYLKHVEGVESLVPFKGSVSEIVDNLLAGIKSGYSYNNAKTTPEIWENAQFVRVTAVGLKENGAHDVLLQSP